MSVRELNAQRFNGFAGPLERRRALGARELEGFRSALAALLDQVPELVVQKVSLASLSDARVEAKGTWTGTAYDPREIKKTIRQVWPGEIFGDADAAWTFEDDEETVNLFFAAGYDGGASKLFGRIRIAPA